MKILIIVAISLAILHVSAQVEVDLTSVPEAELKALQKSVKFKATQAEEQVKNIGKNGGFFNSLFGGKEDSDNKVKFLRGENEQESAEGEDLVTNEITQNQQLKDLGNLMNMLPYEALLPRRRQPLGLLNNLLKGQDESQESNDPLKELDQLLSGRKRNKGKKFHWENPEFKEGKKSTAFSKIFGAKSKGKHRIDIQEEEIQGLLESSMPSLKGGKIINLSYVPHRKGIFLNIEYETAKEQIYKIKAKYMRKSHQLEIINLSQINVLRKVEEDSESESVSEMDITLTKQTTEKERIENAKASEHFEVVQQKEQSKDEGKKVEPKAQKQVSPVEAKQAKKEKDTKTPQTKEKVEKKELKEVEKQSDAADKHSEKTAEKKQEKTDDKQVPRQKQEKEVKKVQKKAANSQLTKQTQDENAIEIN